MTAKQQAQLVVWVRDLLGREGCSGVTLTRVDVAWTLEAIVGEQALRGIVWPNGQYEIAPV